MDVNIWIFAIMWFKCNLTADPDVKILDFLPTAVPAVSQAFGDEVETKDCFYHLTQSTRQKIQEIGLINWYCDNENFWLFCGQLDGLVFLLLLM